MDRHVRASVRDAAALVVPANAVSIPALLRARIDPAGDRTWRAEHYRVRRVIKEELMKDSAKLVFAAGAIFLASSPTQAAEREECWGSFVINAYARTNLAEMQASGDIRLNGTQCTLNGRTGVVSLSADFYNYGDLTVYTWICNEDMSDCGLDNEDSGVYCSADIQARDTSAGTELDDHIGIMGYQTRWNLTYGQMLGELPTDEHNRMPDSVFRLRAHCRWDHD